MKVHGWITMDSVLSAATLLSALNAALCFNIDPVAWKSLQNPAAGFGYQVVQRPPFLLISAPLEQHSRDRKGKLFRCTTNVCTDLPVQVPDFAVNMSLGLSMTSDPVTQNAVACGPTIPKACSSITMYQGVCVHIDQKDTITGPYPSALEECPALADIAFLLDGSGSVSDQDFTRMKDFVKSMVTSFLGKDVRFSIAQFSRETKIHSSFSNFFDGNWEIKIERIWQLQGGTYTAAAIRRVVNDVFNPKAGSRSGVTKVLLVITDGESNDNSHLNSAVSLANRKNIVRFAIGVGNAFSHSKAREELETIASSVNNVFRVDNFAALDQIKNTLQDRIFAIEGSKTGGATLRTEMAQLGFSAAFLLGAFQLAVVGANQWSGGFMEYTLQGGKMKSYMPADLQADSYMGYSMAVAKTQQGQLTVTGAPRYQHRGIVIAVDRDLQEQRIDPFQWEFQVGEYFGAVVLAMNVDQDRFSDAVLISAPMFMEDNGEGRVYACSLVVTKVDCHFDTPTILRGDPSEMGRFGSSLAELPDLNADGFRDLAVGAPLENDGQGSIYIFQGEGRARISPSYSQRIAGSEVEAGLKFFGLSISQSSFDLSLDGLPDLAVGSKGAVVLLRSQPIVMVEAKVSFQPDKIPVQTTDCSQPLRAEARLTFIMSRPSQNFFGARDGKARINYTFTVDATRTPPNNRAYIQPKNQRDDGSLILSSAKPEVAGVTFFIEACPVDALNPLNNELRFTFEGLPSAENLRPSLAQQAQMTSHHLLGFERNCGTDNKCEDNLRVDFNFTRSTEVRVGIDELLNITVSLENIGENSYNTRVLLNYPSGLSYRKFESLLGRSECTSLDSSTSANPGRTTCTIDRPIFKSNSKNVFIVSYGIEADILLERQIFINASAESGNQEHAPSSKLSKTEVIAVKHSIYVTMESSHSYTNFTFGKNKLQKPTRQSILVSNVVRAVNLTLVIRVPIKLGREDIWSDASSLEIPECKIHSDEDPTVTDFVPKIKKDKIVDCSVARCRVFKCNRFMGRQERKQYEISANVSSGWIEQIGLQTAKFVLTSTATLQYDNTRYIFYSTGSSSKSPLHKIEAEVQVYPEVDFTKEIVGGSLGGLVLVALLTAGLYKAGFFNSKYKQLMDEGANAGNTTSAENPQGLETQT